MLFFIFFLQLLFLVSTELFFRISLAGTIELLLDRDPLAVFPLMANGSGDPEVVVFLVTTEDRSVLLGCHYVSSP